MNRLTIARIMEGAPVRETVLSENFGPRWTRPDVTDAHYWELFGYQSELTLEADSGALSILVYHPTLDTESVPEARMLADRLATSFRGSFSSYEGDLLVKFPDEAMLSYAMNSLGRGPQPSDFIH